MFKVAIEENGAMVHEQIFESEKESIAAESFARISAKGKVKRFQEHQGKWVLLERPSRGQAEGILLECRYA